MKSIIALLFLTILGVVASAPAIQDDGTPGGFDIFQAPAILFGIAEGIAKACFDYGLIGARQANEFATDISKSMAQSISSSATLGTKNAYGLGASYLQGNKEFFNNILKQLNFNQIQGQQ